MDEWFGEAGLTPGDMAPGLELSHSGGLDSDLSVQ